MKKRQNTTCRLTENGAGKAAQEGSGETGSRFLFGDRIEILIAFSGAIKDPADPEGMEYMESKMNKDRHGNHVSESWTVHLNLCVKLTFRPLPDKTLTLPTKHLHFGSFQKKRLLFRVSFTKTFTFGSFLEKTFTKRLLPVKKTKFFFPPGDQQLSTAGLLPVNRHIPGRGQADISLEFPYRKPCCNFTFIIPSGFFMRAHEIEVNPS